MTKSAAEGEQQGRTRSVKCASYVAGLALRDVVRALPPRIMTIKAPCETTDKQMTHRRQDIGSERRSGVERMDLRPARPRTGSQSRRPRSSSDGLAPSACNACLRATLHSGRAGADAREHSACEACGAGRAAMLSQCLQARTWNVRRRARATRKRLARAGSAHLVETMCCRAFPLHPDSKTGSIDN